MQAITGSLIGVSKIFGVRDGYLFLWKSRYKN